LRTEPLVIIWRVTGYCDLACRYCGYSRELHRPRAVADPATIRAFGAVLRDYCLHTGRDVLVSWLGGEPLRWPELLDLSAIFARDNGLQVGVTTNGTALLSPAARQRVVTDFTQVTISVDGIGPAHDLCRGAPGLYERLGESVRALSALSAQQGRGPLLRANTVLMRSNIHDMEALCAALAGWGVCELTFNTLGGIERGGGFYQREKLLPEDVAWLRQVLPGMRARLATRGFTIRGSNGYLDLLDHQSRGVPVPIDECAPGLRSLFIDEVGNVGPCSATAASCGVSLDSLRSVEDLLQLPARLASWRRAQAPAACHDCRNTNLFGKFDAGETEHL
jgi:MoaA/NifB/PqqE/SkfB family radical SAM enzyme